ncbi:MAG TPA: 4'-phosphopantetheinyl transferase superfamily protein [Bacilli bacterium]
MRIVAIKCEPDLRFGAELVQSCLQTLPAARRERILRYKKEADRLRSLIGDAAVRMQASLCLSKAPSSLRFTANAHGKPALAEAGTFHFNVSHSGCWVVCAFARFPVGVDIERVRPIRFQIAERFFAAEEAAALRQLPEADRSDYFFDIWTLKESYIKLDGRGLALPLDAFWFRQERNGYVLADGPRKPVCVRHYAIDPHYKCAVCADHDELPKTADVTDAAELLRRYLRLCREF